MGAAEEKGLEAEWTDPAGQQLVALLVSTAGIQLLYHGTCCEDQGCLGSDEIPCQKVGKIMISTDWPTW